MKRLVAMLTMLVLLPLSALASSSLQDEVAAVFKAYRAIGAGVLVAKDGEIVYEQYVGMMDKKNARPVTHDTYFRAASVTKMVSAIHIMQLVEKGLLDVDESIGTYLGYPVINPHFRDIPLTLRHLMTHTSALNTKGGYINRANTLEDLLSSKSKKSYVNFLRRAPGSKYEYSNFGAGIMGSLMEQVTGKTIQDTVSTCLFKPLVLHASFEPTLIPDKENITCLYHENPSRIISQAVTLSQEAPTAPDPNTHFRTTVGDVWITLPSLTRIGMMMVNGGILDGITILQKDTIEEMLANQQGKGFVTGKTPYGLGVHRVENLVDGKVLYGHQGITGSTVCNLYFDPETRFVFAMATNGSSTLMDDRIVKLTRKVFEKLYAVYGAP